MSLELKNFRQHLDTSIVFQDGLTGIVGPNGAGKTTILEAIAWALYGSPAIRGNNSTIRSFASDGGAKAGATLTFELSGQVHRVSRTLDASGRTGHAVLEIDGRAVCTGMNEVSETITRMLGMDYRAFFTSFFTGQKQLEFMAALDGRQREASISRMLGYDRLTKARDQANQDRLGLAREIEGLEKGLADPEELRARRKEAETALAAASKALEQAESDHKSAQENVEKLQPIKDASDQTAKRYDELSRRLETDRADLLHNETRLDQLRKELADLESKRRDLDLLKPDLDRYHEAEREFKHLKELQVHEAERQQLKGQIETHESDLKRLESRLKQLESAHERQTRATIALTEAEKLLAQVDETMRKLREDLVAREHALTAQITGLESRKDEVEANRARIVEAGADGKCPTCERPLAGELEKVLANFDAEIEDLSRRAKELTCEKESLEHEAAASKVAASDRERLVSQIDELRKEKAEADTRVAERDTVLREIETRQSSLNELRSRLAALPQGFDQTRFRELQKIGEELKPVYKRCIELETALERQPTVANEAQELHDRIALIKSRISESEKSIRELAFSPEEHERVTKDFDAAQTDLNRAALELERRKGELKAASAVLDGIKSEEERYKSRVDELKSKRLERLHLQTLAEAFDKLRAELNNRIRPELESIASELLAVMTDGRYNVLRLSDDYKPVVVDDGEEKPVISGGEDDVVNLALRLAVSQMIADRAGQSFSLLILDEVFGSLDELRRDNVVGLLQNLKNRFEQIILITHVESIHDAVDNCLWVEFDERTKTSKLMEREQNLTPALS
ncbi:MAG: AAA family ATPase [Armatimonadetes bacterium]|nr:AAA family ATPase [Armatimonadota bacterium]